MLYMYREGNVRVTKQSIQIYELYWNSVLNRFSPIFSLQVSFLSTVGFTKIIGFLSRSLLSEDFFIIYTYLS